MHQMTMQRVCVWCGVACISTFVGGLFVAHMLPPLSPDDPATEIAQHYRDNTDWIRVGGGILLISGMFYAAFTAVMSAQMRRIPGIHRTAVYTQLAAGAFACLTYMVPAMFLEIAAFRPERAPEDTQTLNDMFWILLVMPWPPFMVQNYAFAYAILTDPRERPLFPRWLAYVNIWAPIIFSPSLLLPFFKDGPFSWGGVFVFWLPGVVFVIQFACNVTMLLRAVRDEEEELTGLKAGAEAPAPAALVT